MTIGVASGLGEFRLKTFPLRKPPDGAIEHHSKVIEQYHWSYSTHCEVMHVWKNYILDISRVEPVSSSCL